MRYCPQCGKATITRTIDRHDRQVCPDEICGFVFWNNPVPIVAVIVETPTGVVLAHHVSWPKKAYSVITGFLEAGEAPEEAARRETIEELGLTPETPTFVGVYSYLRLNQIILAYHVCAQGEIVLNEELDAYKIIPRDKMKAWSFGTGLAVADWLASVKKHPDKSGHTQVED
ncbi:MAG: ADP-ribose pyrophosphatase [Magnetococcales bacterium]|nr:ADP-ribose pyrophosphatase [Magnetococcales bacterium]HIJ84145.1 NUDIX domain-containing protein [Magnetococcales bacterium]